jgi:hypothetical protein
MSTRIQPQNASGRELEEVREVDPDGRIVVHQRAIDTLGKMLRAGTITQAMHDAARDFQASFIIASLDPLRAVPVLRVPGTGRNASLTERQALARWRVAEAIRTLGGHDSPAGSMLWHVVGGGLTLRQWALRQRWGGRPVRQDQAHGVLVASLSVLAGHYGYQRL